jgi:hypothetical protein
MSSVNQLTDLSISNFTNIFDAALNEYKKLTNYNLLTHPFAAVFDSCDSPDAVLNVFRRQARAFDEFCKGDDSLMKWLKSTVHILFSFSATRGNGITLVSDYESMQSLSLCPNMFISAINLHKNNIYSHLCSHRGMPLPKFVDELHEMSVSGSKGRCHKSRDARQPVRAHSIFPSTSQHPHQGPTDSYSYGTTREGHGTGALHSCPIYSSTNAEVYQ